MTLARFVSGLQMEGLPGPVVDQARLSLLNYLACAVAGAREPVVAKAAAALMPLSGKGEVAVVGSPATCDPGTASFLDCLASTILAFDETHARSVVHPVGPVAAAALAISQFHHLDGQRLLVALVAGIEVASRASLAISAAPARGPVGWSQSAVCGSIGAAAAVARLLELDAERTANAIGLGANASAGLRAMNGTMAVSIAVSNAAANGVRAALLAQAGITGSAQALEDPFGFTALYSQAPHLPHLTDGLGDAFAVCELNFKPYPGAVVAHAAIDAALTVRLEPAFAVDAIEDVCVELHPDALALGDRQKVTNDNEASVSIQFWVASALLDSCVHPSCLRPDWIANTDRQQLQKRVHLEARTDMSRDAACLVVRLRGGMRLTAEIAHGRGSRANPMTARDLEMKFRDVASSYHDAERIQHIVEACRAFEGVADVAAFMQLLRSET